MKAINEHIGWGTDGHGLKVLFCNKCREVFYRTPDAGKAIRAQRVFSKSTSAPTNTRGLHDEGENHNDRRRRSRSKFGRSRVFAGTLRRNSGLVVVP